MANKKANYEKSETNRIYVFTDMQLIADSYLQTISWFNQFPSEFSFFILQELKLQPRRFFIIEKFRVISPNIDMMETFSFPKPVFVCAEYHVGIMFSHSALNIPAVGYGHTFSTTQTILTVCHNDFSRNTVIFATLDEVVNRSYHFEMTYCRIQEEVTSSMRCNMFYCKYH